MARAARTEAASQERRNAHPGEHGYALGLAGFITSFFFSVIGLVLSIVGLAQSRRAGLKNPLALWGIIIGAVLTFLSLVGLALATWGIVSLVSYCNAHPNARQCTRYEQQDNSGGRYEMPMGNGQRTY